MKQKSKVEEQKRKLKLRELMLLAELEEERVRIETEQQEIDLHAEMQANTAVSKFVQHHEERSGASVYLSSRIAEELTEKIKKRTPSYLPYSKEVVAQ